MLSTGLMRNLLPKPSKGELLVKDCGDGNCKLYFSLNYHKQFLETINRHHMSGALQRSNAASEWSNLLLAVESADFETNIDTSNLRHHFLSI